MKFIGKLLALPVRLLNVPAKVIENIVDEDTPDEDRFLSRPLDVIADAIEDATDGEK